MYAVKCILREKIYANDKLVEQQEREINLQSNLNSDHVVKLYSVVVQGDYIYILMEFCNGGSLREYLLARGGWLCEEEARFFMI